MSNTQDQYIRKQLKNVRCAFPYLLEPNPKNPTKHTIKLMLPKNDHQTKEIIELFKQLAKNTFGKETMAFGTGQIQDGDLPGKSGEVNEDFKGHYLINPNTKVGNDKFKVLDQARMPIYDKNQIRGGDWVNINLALAAYKHPNYGPKFAVYMNGVQLAKTDLHFSNGSMYADEEFAIIDQAQEEMI